MNKYINGANNASVECKQSHIFNDEAFSSNTRNPESEWRIKYSLDIYFCLQHWTANTFYNANKLFYGHFTICVVNIWKMKIHWNLSWPQILCISFAFAFIKMGMAAEFLWILYTCCGCCLEFGKPIINWVFVFLCLCFVHCLFWL